MKKILLILTVMFSLLLTGCGSKKEVVKEEKTKVGIVLSVAGLGDKSFNDSAYRGLKKAEEELGIEFKYVEPNSPAEDEGFLREFAENDFDLVIGMGFMMMDSVEKVSKEFPDTNFAIIDSVVDTPNTMSINFSEDEGSFLMGALASMMSETGTIGFIGGMEVPLIKKFEVGYVAGAKYVNEDIKPLILYISGPNPFNDPVRGKEAGKSLISQGADVIYHAAGPTGIGMFAAAKEAGIYAIGVDSNQDAEEKGTVLTSMMKNIDTTLYNVVKDLKAGNFKSGTVVFSVAENGVGTTEFEFTKDIIGEEKIAKLKDIEEKLRNKEIKF